MSFVDIITVIGILVSIAGAVATGIAALIEYLRKQGRNTQTMMKVMVIIFGSITSVSAILALSVGLSRPIIAVNHYTGVSLPGQPAQTEANYNTVVVVTPVPTNPTITKTLVENKTLTCISTCTTNLVVVLNTIVVDTTHSRMQWNFTLTNNGTSACSYMYISIYLEDPAGVRTQGDAPGTLTEQNPLNAGQTLQEYTTFALLPQAGLTYTLHASPTCNGSDTDQVETFTF